MYIFDENRTVFLRYIVLSEWMKFPNIFFGKMKFQIQFFY